MTKNSPIIQRGPKGRFELAAPEKPVLQPRPSGSLFNAEKRAAQKRYDESVAIADMIRAAHAEYKINGNQSIRLENNVGKGLGSKPNLSAQEILKQKFIETVQAQNPGVWNAAMDMIAVDNFDRPRNERVGPVLRTISLISNTQQLSGFNLTGAVLRHVKIIGGDISGLRLDDAEITESEIGNATYRFSDGLSFKGAEFGNGTRLFNIKEVVDIPSTDPDVADKNLSDKRAGISFTKGRLAGLTILECVFPGADFTGAHFGKMGQDWNTSNTTEVLRSTMTEADFTGADMRGSRFRKCDLQGANLSKVVLGYLDGDNPNKHQAHFGECDLRGMSYSSKVDLRLGRFYNSAGLPDLSIKPLPAPIAAFYESAEPARSLPETPGVKTVVTTEAFEPTMDEAAHIDEGRLFANLTEGGAQHGRHQSFSEGRQAPSSASRRRLARRPS